MKTAALALLCCLGAASGQEIKVMTSGAFTAAYLELVPQYEKASGNEVSLIWSPAVDIPKRIKGGERAVLETREKSAGIIDAHHLHSARERMRALFDEGFGHRADALDGSVQP